MIQLSSWLMVMGPFERLSPKCSLTHWRPCAGFTASKQAKETWVTIPHVRTFPYSHYFLFIPGKLKSQYPDIYKELLDDLEHFRNYVIDQEMFYIVWGLLERKYEQEYDYPSASAKSLTLDFLLRYFKKTYVSSNSLNGFWQGYIPQVPLTNNHLERWVFLICTILVPNRSLFLIRTILVPNRIFFFAPFLSH